MLPVSLSDRFVFPEKPVMPGFLSGGATFPGFSRRSAPPQDETGPVSPYWAALLIPAGKSPRVRPRRCRGLSPLDRAWPLLCGAVLSAFFSIFVFIPWAEDDRTAAQAETLPEAVLPDTALTETTLAIAPEPFPEIVARPPVHPLALRPAKGDPIHAAWRDRHLRARVLGFFTELTGSEELSFNILDNADTFKIPPSLAFALSWEESRFNPRAVNRANRDSSVDRGLFQLNNRSFPGLSEEQFFDSWQNAYYGMAHLRFCMDRGGSVISALAMYNAGMNRVATGSGAPKHTLDYVSRILDTAARIDELYAAWRPPLAVEESAAIAAEIPPAPFRLARLTPALRTPRPGLK